jgi:hypothetical protein
MPRTPWPHVEPTLESFHNPPVEYGILPFWFLNGELDPDEMRFQLREFRDKGFPGIILHGRFGLEPKYLGEEYHDRIRLAVEEAERLGLTTWIYDEMNWPSGTADGEVLCQRPDLAQRYLECLSFPIRGPWFACLTGGDSRYIDFEKSTPVAAFALAEDGRVVDLTPNLSFENVIPWEVPPGNWRLMYMVEKRADYYIDALDPDATAEFLRLGYAPYAETIGHKMPFPMVGFYTDEPAMHYYVTGADNPIVPWTREMFGRFTDRNGYNLRPRLPDLFFDVSPDSARVRHDFYTTLTALYSDAYFRQIHEWCRDRDVLFTGHLLYEEWLRQMIRVEGNPFSHYRHLDVIGVDHLYPIIGSRDRPAEHVAMKLASSAAHQLGSDRLLCESFGGIFMDATLQRMKWLTDWEYVLGVNLLNPHGYHYTLEGPRKRDWPPSMFYQYPWWHFFDEFSTYVSRLSHLLTGGRHVAKVAVLWPASALFAGYTPQARNPHSTRTESDFNALTDLLLRLHHDFDYLDEDMLAEAAIDSGRIRVRDEAYELLILPPITHLKLSTVDCLERFAGSGGRVLGTVFLPDTAFGDGELVDIGERMHALIGVDAAASQRDYRSATGTETLVQEHPGGGKTGFFHSYAIARMLPMRVQEEIGAVGLPETQHVSIEADGDATRYWLSLPGQERADITAEVVAQRSALADAFRDVLAQLIEPDVVIDNPEIFYLHRIKDERDLYFLVNPTFQPQSAEVRLAGETEPVLWDPSTGAERVIAPSRVREGRTWFRLDLPPAGSAFVTTQPAGAYRVVDTNITVETVTPDRVTGRITGGEAWATISSGGEEERLQAQGGAVLAPLVLDGDWEFIAEDANTLIVDRWLVMPEQDGGVPDAYAAPDADASDWLPVTMGAWAYQLPSEPDRAYPIPVWYRIEFEAAVVPSSLNLIIDGFAGSDWRVFVNGEPVPAKPVRSAIDSQMQALEIAPHARAGRNVIAVRLVLTKPTDGLLDLVKITGDFAVECADSGRPRIVEPRRSLRPASWTEQGYPWYSGRGLYRRRFDLPESFAGQRVHLEAQIVDDAAEFLLNGQRVGVRLWPPYEIDVTEHLQAGENTLEIRVANTLINQLEAVARPSGLSGPSWLVPYRIIEFTVPR